MGKGETGLILMLIKSHPLVSVEVIFGLLVARLQISVLNLFGLNFLSLIAVSEQKCDSSPPSQNQEKKKTKQIKKTK